MIRCNDRDFKYCFSSGQKLTLKSLAICHSGCEGYLSLVNLGTEIIKYSFVDHDVMFEIAPESTENVEVSKEMKVRVLYDTTEYIISETSQFRKLSCKEPFNSVQE